MKRTKFTRRGNKCKNRNQQFFLFVIKLHYKSYYFDISYNKTTENQFKNNN